MKTTYFAMLAAATLAQAQMPGPPPDRGGFGGGMRIMGFEGGKPGAVVTNAPFSGKEVTTETQTLANGTHILHTITAQFYRDASGRTRIERTFSGMGPRAGGTPKTMIDVFDPVAGVAYMLNPDAQTATKMTLPTPPSAADISNWHSTRPSKPSSEETKTDLGTQTVQGISCTGTRITRTIAVGEMGNDQEITVTTERWYSSDLQIALQTKRSDPRVGEVVFEFQNISRTAPDPSLFQPPASYTVTTKTATSKRMGMERAPGPPAEQ